MHEFFAHYFRANLLVFLSTVSKCSTLPSIVPSKKSKIIEHIRNKHLCFSVNREEVI